MMFRTKAPIRLTETRRSMSLRDSQAGKESGYGYRVEPLKAPTTDAIIRCMKPMAETSTSDCGINIRFHRF